MLLPPNGNKSNSTASKSDVPKAVYNKAFTEGISPRRTHSKVGGEFILQ